jgi:hypothetical protein
MARKSCLHIRYRALELGRAQLLSERVQLCRERHVIALSSPNLRQFALYRRSP